MSSESPVLVAAWKRLNPETVGKERAEGLAHAFAVIEPAIAQLNG